MICTECGSKLVRVDTPLIEELRGEEFTVKGIERYECPECGNYELDLDMMDKLSASIWEQYRKKHRILSPEQIKKIRINLGITQTDLEAMLCVSHPTVSRWETGMFVPSMQSNRELELLRDCSDSANYLMSKAEIHPKSKNSYQKEFEFTLSDVKQSQKTIKQPNFVLD